MHTKLRETFRVRNPWPNLLRKTFAAENSGKKQRVKATTEQAF